MTWCMSCGEQYAGPGHNCGYARVSNDRLRELERAEDALRNLVRWGHGSDAPDDCVRDWREATRLVGAA